MALLVYAGAIYPLPQTALVLFVMAVITAVSNRSYKPLAVVGVAGAIAIGLAAPRLFPLLAELSRSPRVVPSDENVDLARFVALFTQKANDPHPVIMPWGWHEFGIYIGWVPFALMVATMFTFRTARERALVYPGVLCLLLGFGRIFSVAPWALLHDHVPVFKSQHVPTRWLIAGVLLLLLAAATIAERWLDERGWRSRFEVGCLVVAAALSLDIALEAHHVLSGALARAAPNVAESTAPFHQESVVPPELEWEEPDWAPPSLPPMLANVGVIQCPTFHEQTYERVGPHAWALLRGVTPAVHGRGDPDYRGEAYFEDGPGIASITSWSPNAVTIRYDGARAGDLLVMNQRWDPGWRARDHAVIDEHGLTATRVEQASGEITFRYAAPYLWLGLLVLAATLAAIAFAWITRRA
jgi:hypothetical protein